jgi:hypothetical protein
MDSEQPQFNESEQRAILIKEIGIRDTAAFFEWADLHEGDSRLDLPLEALRYLIPPRIFEFAHSPEAVTIRVAQQDRGEVSFYVVEEQTSSNTQKPEDANWGHWESREEVVSGIVKPDDFIFTKVDLERINGGWDTDLFVKSYDDRGELVGQGIATSFYTRLAEFAAEMDFHSITGQNTEQNVGFFLSIGRDRLTELNPSTQNEYAAKYGDRIKDPENFTVMPIATLEE